MAAFGKRGPRQRKGMKSAWAGARRIFRRGGTKKGRVIGPKQDMRFETSTYAAAQIGRTLYVGGSDWNRRKTTYSRGIARESKGVLHILRKTIRGRKVTKKVFPSMVYSVVGLPRGLIFVGCKSVKGALSLTDRKGNVVLQRDDPLGTGVYNAVYNRKRNEIIISTRSGILEVVDAGTLRIKGQLPLSSERSRLWSLKFDEERGTVYAGDYDGVLYAINTENLSRENVLRFDFKSLHKGDKRLREEFGPSLWGLELIGKNRLIAGTRWGDIAILEPEPESKSFKVIQHLKTGESVSCMEKLTDKVILIGTRHGRLFSFNPEKQEMRKVMEVPPALQKENAIWGMRRAKDGVLVCFADGRVSKVGY